MTSRARWRMLGAAGLAASIVGGTVATGSADDAKAPVIVDSLARRSRVSHGRA